MHDANAIVRYNEVQLTVTLFRNDCKIFEVEIIKAIFKPKPSHGHTSKNASVDPLLDTHFLKTKASEAQSAPKAHFEKTAR